ncbi:MAG: ribbon-helix-helix protein, CopG family [Acidobacteria bacterium]|nr:ribbon-helix-helix protein, CopG family [Acidobacteriota bacterium]
MQKTTVYMDESTYRRLKQIARARRRPPAEMVREAVAEFAARHAPRRTPKSIGAFKSGRRDLGQRAEELLSGIGKDR